ncbi:DUF169 domain-containing protein [Candidatus Enterococcus ferrettii]|uniref:DUF169 domain-containing protein n=1 Tax=Candidatus Enterococcus ferrettii TaxID=2815324 RepID=A0ABV0EWK3_9ENTE|nr:DUF169 domain-containing protein [Enterococcus sp. 665A]
MSNFNELNKRLNYLLNLERQAVGITFLHSKEDFQQHPAPKYPKMIPYCGAVQKATMGEQMKLDLSNFACPASAVAMGLVDNDEYSASGEKHANMKVYKDIEVSKQVADDMVYCREASYGIAIEPIETWTKAPDVVLLITVPFNAMRILQGNAYHYGQVKQIKMTGMQALCQEGTSYPFETNEINVSMMCSGTRYVARWKDEELCIGIPYNKFEKVIDGLEQTLNPMELLEKKRQIIKKTQENDEAEFYDVRKRDNYFRGAYQGVKRAGRVHDQD